MTSSRLTNDTFQMDMPQIRQGYFADKYFANIATMLAGVGLDGGYNGRFPRDIGRDAQAFNVGDVEVEMQIFTRHRGQTVVAGVDQALEMLRLGTGYHESDGRWVDSYHTLEVEAIQDGDTVHYHGEPKRVQPVMKVRGRYRDFALLETTLLGVLSRSSRVATNVYHVLREAKGKPVLFFPARFDLPETQAADGYAYYIATQRYNQDYDQQVVPAVSTDAQGSWWGGQGGGTLAHAAIACFLGDTAATVMAFATYVPSEIPRIALVDFNNDCVTASQRTAEQMFTRYWDLLIQGDESEAEKYRLAGVRLDTSSGMRDVSVAPLGDQVLDFGVNPRLVFAVRAGLDDAWRAWDLPTAAAQQAAEAYCHAIKIVVTGGFTAEKIRKFEKMGVPADIYGVGSSLFRNDKMTNCDYTADIVRLKVDGRWVDLAKTGRAPSHNPNLDPV